MKIQTSTMGRGGSGRQVSPNHLPCTVVDPSAEQPEAVAPTGEVAATDPEQEGRIQRTTRRAKAQQERLTQRAGDTLGKLEAARPDSPWIDAVFRTYERDTATGGVVLAGALAVR